MSIQANIYTNIYSKEITGKFPKPEIAPYIFGRASKANNSLLESIKPKTYTIGQRSPEIKNIKKILNRWLPDGIHLDGFNEKGKANPENDIWTPDASKTLEIITIIYNIKCGALNQITSGHIKKFKNILDGHCNIDGDEDNAENKRLRNLVRMYNPEIGLEKYNYWKEEKSKNVPNNDIYFNIVSPSTDYALYGLSRKYHFNKDRLVNKVRNAQNRKFKLETFFSALVEASKTFNMDPALICAFIERESHFDADAEAWTGDIGLTQVTPPAVWELCEHRKHCNKDEPYNKYETWFYAYRPNVYKVRENILLGTAYLRYMFDNFEVYKNKKPYYCGQNYLENDALMRAIAAYNIGTGNAEQITKTEDLKEIEYVKGILKNYEYYKKEYAAGR